MKKYFFYVLLLSIVSDVTDAQNSIVIKNVAVVDVNTGKVGRNRTVIIQGNRITAIGVKVNSQGNATIIDGTGKYLIPGLWDMHAHTLTDKRYQYSFPLLIANGVTGVREMGSNLPIEEINQIRKDIEEGRMLGPRFGATTYRILDGTGSQFGVAIIIPSGDSGRAVVRTFKQAGADFIKPYNLLSRESYLAIADEARKQVIPIEGHVPFSMTATEVSNLGQKTIEHDFDILVSCSKEENELRKDLKQQTWGQTEAKAAVTYDEQKAKKLFALFARNGTWMCPTIAFYKPMWWIADENEVLKDSMLKYIPKPLIEGWHTPFQRLSHNTVEEYRKKHYEMRSRIVKEMHDAGVPILAGTDTGSPFSVPGFSLHNELQALVDAGLSNIAALKAATVNPVKFLGREKDLGSIEKGKIADLVLLDANPLLNISNTNKIHAVIVNGKLFNRTELDAMLEQVKQLAAR